MSKKLALEDRNFRVKSDGWKRITVDGKEYLENPERDIWEIFGGKLNGEQLFTWQAAERETQKAGKRIPTDKEFSKILKTKTNIPNLAFAGGRHLGGTFFKQSNAAIWSSTEYEPSGVFARFWDSNLTTICWRSVSDRMNGLSVRCLRD